MNSFELKPKKGYGFIYMYTSPSNKSYIGQTIRSLSERAQKNGNGYVGCPIFFRAIQKYNFKNFKYQILGEFKIEDLDQKEIEFIKKYNTLQPNGYNIQKGGAEEYKRIKHGTKINQFDLDGNFIKQYSSVAQAAEDNNTIYQAISAVLSKKRKQHNGYIYRYDNEEKPLPVQVKHTHGKKTAQYDLEGNLLNIFDSATQAGKSLGKDGRNIRSVCDGKRQSAYGFKWKYLD